MRTNKKPAGMTMTLSRAKWAFRELYGRPLKLDEERSNESFNRMFREFGEPAILKALESYTDEAYFNRKDV